MARTFIGELVLRLKDEMSGKAKQVAGNLDSSIDRIQRAARKLNQTSWGGQFEERLRKRGHRPPMSTSSGSHGIRCMLP